MASDSHYYKLAQSAATKIGWFPQVVMSQWQLETGHFTSNNFKLNNNIAGQTWTQSSLYPKGTQRREGGYYIKYPDPVMGYVDFIQRNHRYDNVKGAKTINEAFDLIAKDGWAADPFYSSKLKSMHQMNIKNGVYKDEGNNGLPFPDVSGLLKNPVVWLSLSMVFILKIM